MGSVTMSNNFSCVLYKAHEVKYEDRPIPKIEDPNEVIVEVKWTGICGSDVHFWTEGRLGPFVVEEPMTLGHESSGVVHSVGSAVKMLQAGDKVAMEPGIPCRMCTACKSGFYNLCRAITFAATPPTHGTLCRYYKLPADLCYKLPAHVSLQAGALVEPTAVAVHAVRQSALRAGDCVVVYGAGPVGLLCAAVARGSGARGVVVVDTNETRLAFARTWVPGGCGTFVAKPGEQAQAAALRLRAENADQLPAEGADIVLEATGAAPCGQAAVWVARPGATIVQVGIGAAELAFPIAVLCANEITLRGTFRYKEGDYNVAVGMIAGGSVDAERLISSTVPFEEAETAFGKTKKGEGIKTLIAAPT